MTTVVQIKGDKARLLPVAERTRFLFATPADRQGRPAGGQGKDGAARSPQHSKKKQAQLNLFETLQELDHAEGGGNAGEPPTPRAGHTVLDRIHQSMILFAAGRSEALKRFRIEEAVGRDARFWRLAQSLSALYPAASDEKRWGDGVLARKKGLGL